MEGEQTTVDIVREINAEDPETGEIETYFAHVCLECAECGNTWILQVNHLDVECAKCGIEGERSNREIVFRLTATYDSVWDVESEDDEPEIEPYLQQAEKVTRTIRSLVDGEWQFHTISDFGENEFVLIRSVNQGDGLNWDVLERKGEEYRDHMNGLA